MKRDQFDIHLVHQALKSCIEELNSYAKVPRDPTADFDSSITQLRYVQWCLKESDHTLIFPSMLDQMEVRAQTLLEFLRNSSFRIRETPDVTEVASFEATIAGYVSQLFEVMSFPRLKKIFSSEYNQAINDVKESSSSIIVGLRNQASSAEKSLRLGISILQDEIKKEQVALSKQVELLGNLQQSIADRIASLNSEATTKAAVFDELIEERRNQLGTWAATVEDEGRKILGETESFYKLTANTTLAGRFEEASRKETTSYWINFGAAICFFLLAIGSIMFDTWYLHPGGAGMTGDPLFLWLGKVSLVAACVFPATIFASQAGKHRRAATWYKTLGVRIATLKPYLSEFEGNYEEELKVVIKNFFVSELDVDNRRRLGRQSATKDISSLAGLLEEVLSKIK
jgi:hypothetical protein